jgi:hypothetical protein
MRVSSLGLIIEIRGNGLRPAALRSGSMNQTHCSDGRPSPVLNVALSLRVICLDVTVSARWMEVWGGNKMLLSFSGC